MILCAYTSLQFWSVVETTATYAACICYFHTVAATTGILLQTPAFIAGTPRARNPFARGRVASYCSCPFSASLTYFRTERSCIVRAGFSNTLRISIRLHNSNWTLHIQVLREHICLFLTFIFCAIIFQKNKNLNILSLN